MYRGGARARVGERGGGAEARTLQAAVCRQVSADLRVRRRGIYCRINSRDSGHTGRASQAHTAHRHTVSKAHRHSSTHSTEHQT